MVFGGFAQASDYDFNVKSIIEPYVLTGAPAGQVSNSVFLTVEQSWLSSRKNNKLIAQFNFANANFQINDIKYQNNEIFPGELYYEWSQSFQRLAAGFQYLLWVDGFDTIGMESFNPEDQNQSIFSESSRRYRSVPAFSYKVIFNNVNFQIVNVFQPPADSPNIFLLNQMRFASGFTEIEDPDKSQISKRNDFGFRVAGSAGIADWSLYGLQVYDKSAFYIYNVAQMTMAKTRLPYKAAGGNLTFDINGHIVRLDIKYNDQRSFTNINLDTEKSNEALLNLGYEAPEIAGWQLSFNYSQSELSRNVEYLTRKRKIQDVYVRATKKFNASYNLNSMVIQRVSDLGYAVHFEIENNLSKSQDIRLGAEYFANKENTAFGLLKDLSRVYIGINSYFEN